MGPLDPLLLSTVEFHREVARERIRATRRSIPFCLIAIELKGRDQRRRRARMLVRLLHRNLRMTDHKGMLTASKFGVLLVDTPEMGGRAALDRIAQLSDRHNLRAVFHLQVHDPEGFDPDNDPPTDGGRRHDDEPSAQWQRIEGGGDVEVSAEDPLVPRPFWRMTVKRTIDIFGGTIGLIFTSPLILLGVVAIKLSDSGPAFFTQTREGYRGRPFTIYKLRTMVVDAEHSQAALRDQNHRDGPAFKIAKDPRVTRVGEFLRKTCIDELPQLWNVIKGDMSLVGPRPLPWHESRACDSWHRRRLDVRPGMTCYWQVDKSQAETFDDWMRLDLRYIDELGLLQDLKLIARTFTVPMTGRGGE